MKTTIKIMTLLFIINNSIWAQTQVTVEAKNNDISNNLDLQAVASIFGDSKDLQEFEMKLNDNDAQISNLDLNNDGEVDYLRVIETTENNVHLVVIQAVLERDVFQDIATILIQRNNNRKTVVQVIGAPYIYGANYIIEPVYVYTPVIYSYFWQPAFRPWVSPYYWGYYPTCYHVRRPYEISLYSTHIHTHINHNHRYYYTERRRYDNYDRIYQSVSRNDYGTRYPDRSFNSRYTNVRNRQEYDRRYNTNSSLLARPSNEVGRRNYSNDGRSYTNSSTTSRGNSSRTYNSNSTPNYQRSSNSSSRTSSYNESRTTPSVRQQTQQRATPSVQSSNRSSSSRVSERPQSTQSRGASTRTQSSARPAQSSSGGRR